MRWLFDLGDRPETPDSKHVCNVWRTHRLLHGVVLFHPLCKFVTKLRDRGWNFAGLFHPPEFRGNPLLNIGRLSVLARVFGQECKQVLAHHLDPVGASTIDYVLLACPVLPPINFKSRAPESGVAIAIRNVGSDPPYSPFSCFPLSGRQIRRGRPLE